MPWRLPAPQHLAPRREALVAAQDHPAALIAGRDQGERRGGRRADRFWVRLDPAACRRPRLRRVPEGVRQAAGASDSLPPSLLGLLGLRGLDERLCSRILALFAPRANPVLDLSRPVPTRARPGGLPLAPAAGCLVQARCFLSGHASRRVPGALRKYVPPPHTEVLADFPISRYPAVIHSVTLPPAARAGAHHTPKASFRLSRRKSRRT